MLWCVQFTDSDYTYMLDFVDDNNKKMAFATSVGFLWKNQEEERIKALLGKFKVIAVREQDTAILLNNILKKDIKTVCDPTMLISPDIWKTYAKTSTSNKKYCLIYMDDEKKNCLQNARKYCRKNKMPIYVIALKNILRIGYQNKAAIGIDDFLGYILNAEIVFTASYHGMLFAIYFHVPFVFYNKDPFRLINLADKLGVSNRNGDLYDISEMEPINWKMVDVKRENYVVYSKEILANIILN